MDKANVADNVTSVKAKASGFIKSKMFDIIAVAIVMAMLALSLGVFELRDLSLKELANILLETLPFYLATVMLNDNYYLKGIYDGKVTKSFTAVVNAYSTIVNKLTGKEIKSLPDFCEKYNDNVMKKLQTSILRSEALTYEDFTVN